MRIIIAQSRLDTFGGGERATLELARRLSARHAVSIVTSAYIPQRTFAGLAEFPLRITPPAEWLSQPLAADALVAQNFGARLLALRRRGVIAYLHTMRSVYLRGGRRPDLALRRALDRRAVRRAAFLLTNSAYTAERAARFYGRTPEVVPLGADEALARLEPQVGSYALYVGRLAPEKGVARLLEWSADSPMALEVVGAGSPAERAHLSALLGPRARLRGPLTGPALAAAYAGARFFAFTPHAEEFGLAALDAMAAAKPVIAVREGALPELIEDGVTGFLVGDRDEFQRAAERLSADDALCLRMGLAARERARRYSWDEYARRIEALCEQVAGNLTSPAPSPAGEGEQERA
ncbi:MAG TPA: glycosyltransferase family 4 protein [Ktedonobacterales bacterium]|nr:glycosyltransferase family 4 protein [Ktedonobacterales bacterium]